MPLLAGSRLGPYEILAQIGKGGMGEVYRARDTKLKREVALKVLPEALAKDPDRRARFQHEAEVLASLNHPNIGAIYGLEDSAGTAALVMELVHGGSLSERMRSRGMPLSEALNLSIQIVSGLEAAHKVGIVHRDLKPSNVMVTSDGVVKLVDFGLAKLLDTTRQRTDETETIAAVPRTEDGQILGSIAYMSPEQAQAKPVDVRSDLFSFGTLLYEMLTGMRPFQGETKMSTLAAILQQNPKPPSELTATPLPREAERIILRCLRKDADRRFQTASDLRLAMEDLKEDSSAGPLGSTPGPVSVGRPRWYWAVGAIAVLGLTGAGALLLFTRGSPPPRHPLKQITFDASVARSPVLSPDGKLLAYASDNGGEDKLDIWLKQMAGGDPVRLTSSPGSKTNPQFSADGTKIYYLSGGDLFEIPTLGGASRRVFEGAGQFSVSPRGEIAFYRSGTGASPGPITLLPAGGGVPEPWRTECVSLGPPAWSPEGDRLAFAGSCDGAQNASPGTVPKVTLMIAPRRGGAIQPIALLSYEQVFTSIEALHLAWFRLGNGSEGFLAPGRSDDSTNLFRVALDGKREQITFGTGVESEPSVSPGGDVVFSRGESSTAVWSVPLSGALDKPLKEAAPATYFATSPDGTKLVYGRMLGSMHGELVLRDRMKGAQTVLAAHDVGVSGVGSFWPQVSPDGKRIIYRAFTNANRLYLVSTEGGVPRSLDAAGFSLASDWSPDGTRVIGECAPLSDGICELDPSTGRVRRLLRDSQAGELLYPSFSWDGKWVAFMRRRGGRTTIEATPVRENGSLADEGEWIRISSEGNASRPRFAPDGSSLYYLIVRGSRARLIQQKLDPVNKKPAGDPVQLTSVPFSSGDVSLISVTRDRLFFNTREVRSNVWMTNVE
jgi:serine/threonine protein kinase